MEENCLFCKIANKEISSEIVYETDDVIVFKDIHPVAPIHVLAIPKKHILCLNEISDEDVSLMGKIQLAIKETAKVLGISENGYRVISNCGSDGGQVVNHLHYHLLGGKQLGSKLVKE